MLYIKNGVFIYITLIFTQKKNFVRVTCAACFRSKIRVSGIEWMKIENKERIYTNTNAHTWQTEEVHVSLFTFWFWKAVYFLFCRIDDDDSYGPDGEKIMKHEFTIEFLASFVVFLLGCLRLQHGRGELIECYKKTCFFVFLGDLRMWSFIKCIYWSLDFFFGIEKYRMSR